MKSPLFIVSSSRLALSVVLSIALVLAGCNTSDPSPGAPATTAAADDLQTVIVAYPVDMVGVNELTLHLTSLQTVLLYFALFMPLLEEQADYEEGPPTFEPRLAASYDFSQDRKTLTFKLRENLVWSDGVPITSEDVRWTWEAQLHPDIAWSYASTKERIEDVEVVDEHTVRFHFKEAYATQLIDVNQGVILPKHAWSELPFSEWRESSEWFIDHLVVSGPFNLASWEPQQRIVLERNPRYFEEGKPRIDRLVFQITPDVDSQLALLRSGQAHLVEWIRPSDAQTILEHPNLKMLSYVPRQYVFLSWNTSLPFFDEKEERQALTMAIDRRSIIDAIYYGYANLSYSPYVSNSWVHNKNLEPWPYDPERAKKQLASLGWVDSDGDGILDQDGIPFRFELLTNADNEIRRDILVMIQEQLRRVGIDAQTRSIEFNTLFDREMAHDYEASIAAVAVDTSLNLSMFFHSRSHEDGWNWGLYTNPEVDRLIDQLEQEIDQLAAKPLYDELQTLIHEDQPITFLYEPVRLVGLDKRLHGVVPTPISTYFTLADWWLEDEE